MKLLTSLILSASLLCAGQSAPSYTTANEGIGSGDLVYIPPVKPHHSHKKLYMMLAMTAASAITSYEMYSHMHHSPGQPMLPNPPSPAKPDLFIITCGVCNSKGN